MAMDAAPRAGHTGQALARLADFLRVTRDVDYVRPLCATGRSAGP